MLNVIELYQEETSVAQSDSGNRNSSVAGAQTGVGEGQIPKVLVISLPFTMWLLN